MRSFFSLLLLLTLNQAFAQQPANLVNPFVATEKPRYDFFGSATLPSGMVALSPDTRHGDLWDAGYRYNDGYVLNFSHVHNAQTAGIPVMPVVGTCKALQGLASSKSKFTHQSEIAHLGYHKVVLDDYGITAELTASLRAGFHRYTFPEAKEAHIIMDLTAPLGPVSMDRAYAKKVSSTEVAGYSVNSPTFRRKKPFKVYFFARFSKPFNKLNFWKAESETSAQKVLAESDMVDDKKAGLYVSYYDLKAHEQIMVQVGISYVSTENAKLNLDTEIPDWNFDLVAAKATKAWNEYLGRIEIKGGTKKQQTKFYTDLAHTAMGRRIAEDVNGAYIDNNGDKPVVRQVSMNKGVPAYHFLDADGLWGSHWNLNILWSMVYPEFGNNLASTFIDYYKNMGLLGRTSWGGEECYVMVGDQTVPLLAALMQTGRATFDKELAYKGAYKNAFPGGIKDRAGYESGPNPAGGGIDWYLKYGYVPIEIQGRGQGFHRGGAAMTLEYAYQDWCVANMALTLGKKKDSQLFLKRAGNWKNLFDVSTGYIRPKDTLGKWLSPFVPLDLRGGSAGGFAMPGFIESSSAVYSYYVPQDVNGLIKKMGGNDSFIKRLDTSFQKSVSVEFAADHGHHGGALVDYDNQPSCEIAHLFSYAGAPWKTQYWVRQVKEITFGGITPSSGYKGDEDQGQMSALSTLMSVGLFNVQGLANINPSLEITSPIFDKITFHLPGKKTFVIETRSPVEKDNTYIQSVLINGKTWTSFKFPFSVFANGGTMKIDLGPSPNKTWGITK
ncbi:glycoside hydrolase family 92 protein [Pedobacter sp. KBW01]|uniref:GH92 family glycosyl hydrolase n=1 Tax=Pedobacter sp. KBW01 TaxID=2153364 RepID=UPI000F59ED8F|nr:GH92 family glycosyl hydrolase [Pedobacter sp. KBW01]RQO66564.1 glycoside hydrolase family 92 protein [Pedobacter sp. KBW01]